MTTYLVHIDHDRLPHPQTSRNLIRETAQLVIEATIQKALERADEYGEAAVRIVIKQEKE